MSSKSRSRRIQDELSAVAGHEFEILREVGRGGMGWVFLARDRRLNRRVALKVLSPALLMEEGMGERFLREAQILASLRHAHIVGVHAVHHVDDMHYFVMDFIDGPSLDHVLRSRGRLEISTVRTIAYMVGSALDYGHHRGRGVIHRDIKPANVILDSDGSVVVTDFGISKLLTGNTRLTRTGVVVGTPEFMSPEQCGGVEIGAASDQYSLGALLYQMVTGSPPFSGGTVEVLVGHVQGTPDAVLDRRPDCPPEMAAAIERMLAKSPDARFADIGSALDEMGAGPVRLRSDRRKELAALARTTVTSTSAIDISSPLSPVRGPDSAGDVAPAERASSGGLVTGGAAGPVTGDTVSTLFLGSPSLTMRSGESIPIWVDARDAEGRAVPEAAIELSVDHPDVAMLDEGGLLVALRSGTVTVTATTGQMERQVQVEIVDPPYPARIVVEPAELDLVVGESRPVSAEVFDQMGEPLDHSVEWAAEDPDLVRMDGTPLTGASVTALAEGESVVGVSAGSLSVSIPVSARRLPVAIVLGGIPDSVEVGDDFEVIALVVDVNGMPIDGLEVEWRSTNAAVLEIDDGGRVHPVAPGTVSILARHKGCRQSVVLDVVPTAPPVAAPPVAVPPVAVPPPVAPPPAGVAGAPSERETAKGEAAQQPRGVLQSRRRSRAAAASPTLSPVQIGSGVAVVAVVAVLGWFAATRGDGDPPPASSVAVEGPGATAGLSFAILPVGPLTVGDSVDVRTDLAAAEVARADWVSSNAGVVQVLDGGAIRAVAPGFADLRLLLDGDEATIRVEVRATPAGTATAAAPGAAAPGTATDDAAAVDPDPAPTDEAPDDPPPVPVDAAPTPTPPATEPESTPPASTRPAVPASEEPPPPAPAEVRIRVRPEAVTLVDGEPSPEAARSTNILTLAPGEYRIQLTRPGFVPFDTLVVLEPAQIVVIRTNLAPSGTR